LIDDLIISIHGHNQELIEKQSKNKNLHKNLIKALANINKYFNGRVLKANCVINKLNYRFLPEIVKFIDQSKIKEINLTSLDIRDYNKSLSINFNKLMPTINKIVTYSQENNLILRFSDIPLCLLGEHQHLANDLYFDNREKYYHDGKKDKNFGRAKIKIKACEKCNKNNICLGIDEDYYHQYGDKGLNLPV